MLIDLISLYRQAALLALNIHMRLAALVYQMFSRSSNVEISVAFITAYQNCALIYEVFLHVFVVLPTVLTNSRTIIILIVLRVRLDRIFKNALFAIGKIDIYVSVILILPELLGLVYLVFLLTLQDIYRFF